MRLRFARRNGNVHVARGDAGLRGHAFDRPLFAPELAADHPRPAPVVLDHFGNRAGGNVLVARVSHFERGGQIGPQLKAVHAARASPLGIS